MTFYLVIAPSLLAALYMILRLRGLRKHDAVLYKFCQVRRDTMASIREHNFDLAREDYYALKELADVTGATIHDYQLCKIYVFNFRRFLRAIQRFKGIERKTNPGKLLRKEILKLRENFARALISSFFTYTPFLRSEIVLKALSKVAKAFAKLGIDHAREQAKQIGEILSWVEREKRVLHFN